MDYCIFYDSDAADGKIKRCVEQMMRILRRYSIRVTIKQLEHIETFSENLKFMIFITALDSDHFHGKVKRRFIDGCPKSMLVLEYSPAYETHIRRFTKAIKAGVKERHDKESQTKEFEAIIKRIVLLNDVNRLSTWWPEVLNFLQIKQENSYQRSNARREIGVFYKINPEDESQIEWFDEQRKILEKTFRIRCRYNDGHLDEETYIKCSNTVVMYLDRQSYQKAATEDERKQGKKKMLDSVEKTRNMCRRHKAQFQVYVDEAGSNLNKKLAHYSLKFIGYGMMHYWVALLADLEKVHIRPIPDSAFYSQNGKENEQHLFHVEDYPHLKQVRKEGTVLSARVATPSNVLLGGSEKGACYQYQANITVTVVNDQENLPGPSVKCCRWFI